MSNEFVKKYFPALVEACRTIGAKQIQNRGTIGGNIMNASPAGDTLPVLMVYDTEAVLASENGERKIAFKDFFTGYRKTSMKSGEILKSIIIGKTKRGERSAFYKTGTRKAQAISKVMGAFRVRQDNEVISEVAISYGSVAPVPVRSVKTEEYLKGKAASEEVINEAVKILKTEISPIDDIRSTSAYRSHVAGILLKRFLNSSP